jgi:oligopeptide/dipeptide ABC transporter ATP-binding protein
MSLLELDNLKTYYFSSLGIVKAVDGVSIKLNKGETLGLVGESGCGKSTTGLSILRLIRPPGKIVGGKIKFAGEDLMTKSEEEMRSIRGKRIAMVPQDPMTCLNPLMKVGEHIVETITVHDTISKEEAWKRAKELAYNLDITPQRLTEYPHQFSGGMRQRIMIGLAIALNPSLIIADEPTTSLDVIVQAQILELFKELRNRYDLTMIMITHNMSVVAELSNKIAVMYAGKIVEFSDVISLYRNPLHPYTQNLLKCVANINLSEQMMKWIPGVPPNLINPPTGCRFHTRCSHVRDACRNSVPSLISVEPDHLVACVLYDKR